MCYHTFMIYGYILFSCIIIMKKAVLIGINYAQDNDLRLNGCINDTVTVTRFLKEHNFTQDDITVATDNDGSWGTRQDILDEVDKLASFGIENPDALLWLSFSGHGGQTMKNYANTNEADRKNEALVPTDYYKSGFVTDDELYCAINTRM